MNINLETLRALSISFLESLNINSKAAIWIQSIIVLVFIFFTSYIIGRFSAFLMQKMVNKIVKKTKNNWDNLLHKNKVFAILSYYLFGISIFWLDQLIASEAIRVVFQKTMGAFFIIVTGVLLNALIDTANDVYNVVRKNKQISIKIYLQLLKIVLFSLSIIVIISIVADLDLLDIFTTLGAMLTILLIVYKDTIMGFVAGISLSTNKMIQLGDWISVPQHNADGTVIDIGINTIRIQNWDKTITTIPPYKLMSESFTNWKGMEESGGRRIKRSIYINIDSIHFLSEDEIEKLYKFKLLQDYLDKKKKEIQIANDNENFLINQRRLTNVGTFKKYIEYYLVSTGYVHPGLTFIVRQLQSSEKGLPLEIYFFSNEQVWKTYEQIQSDIFDHIFAIVPEFNLKIFQNPSGNDIVDAFKDTKKIF